MENVEPVSSATANQAGESWRRFIDPMPTRRSSDHGDEEWPYLDGTGQITKNGREYASWLLGWVMGAVPEAAFMVKVPVDYLGAVLVALVTHGWSVRTYSYADPEGKTAVTLDAFRS